jgi:hypothetical protein
MAPSFTVNVDWLSLAFHPFSDFPSNSETQSAAALSLPSPTKAATANKNRDPRRFIDFLLTVKFGLAFECHA